MVDKQPSQTETARTQKPRPRRSTIVRILRTLKRRSHSREREQEKEHADNERMMARWARRVGWFTVVLAVCAIANVWLIKLQLGEMHSGGLDTHNLAVAAHDQAVATSSLKGAGEAQAKALDKLRLAGQAQAVAADKLRQAGESQASAAKLQARAMEGLRGAGEAQARSTASLAENSGRQIGALTDSASAARTQADAARAQAAAITKSADAAIIQSNATDRLSLSGKAQADAVVDSLQVAREANAISEKSSSALTRPWIDFDGPVGEIEPVAGQDYVATPTLINPGHSPAMSVSVLIVLAIMSPGDQIGALPKCQTGCAEMTIFPTNGGIGGTSLVFHPRIDKSVMTVSAVADLATGKKVVVLRERADYVDGGGTDHTTVACLYYVPKSFKLGGFTSCQGGNGAS